MITVASIGLAESAVGDLLWWLVLGLLAGFLASQVMRGGGYGVLGDIIVGIIGSLLGGFLAGLLGLGSSGFLGSLIIAFLGACLFIAILRAFSRSSYGHRTMP